MKPIQPKQPRHDQPAAAGESRPIPNIDNSTGPNHSDNHIPGHDAPLTQAQIMQLRLMIDRRKRALLERMRNIVPALDTNAVTQPLAVVPPDVSPNAIRLNDSDREILPRDVHELIAIEATIDAIEAQRYGECTVCHAAIGFRRLLALPTALRCLPCQRDAERAEWQVAAQAPATSCSSASSRTWGTTALDCDDRQDRSAKSD